MPPQEKYLVLLSIAHHALNFTIQIELLDMLIAEGRIQNRTLFLTRHRGTAFASPDILQLRNIRHDIKIIN